MRLLAALLAMAGMTSVALAADAYPAPPPQRQVYKRPPQLAHRPPPRVRYAERPVGIVTEPAGWAYVVPQPAYQPGSEYFQSPALVDGTRYRRHCWMEWGYPRCTLTGGELMFWTPRP